MENGDQDYGQGQGSGRCPGAQALPRPHGAVARLIAQGLSEFSNFLSKRAGVRGGLALTREEGMLRADEAPAGQGGCTSDVTSGAIRDIELGLSAYLM
jgi:hypothetical protein